MVIKVKFQIMKSCSVPGCQNKHSAKGYCMLHYSRNRFNIPFDRPLHVWTGKYSPNWKGGIYPYPNNSLRQHNRLIKIEQMHGMCEICGKYTDRIHHIDKTKTNHSLENLMLLCPKCHYRLHRVERIKSSKWLRLYGLRAKDLCKKLKCSYYTLLDWHKNGRLKFFLMGKRCF